MAWFAETSLVVQWWRLHLLMQGVQVRAKSVAHASKSNKQTKNKKTKHKQQDIVTNSTKTLEIVHIKKKKKSEKKMTWFSFQSSTSQSLSIVKSSWLELGTVSFPTLQTFTVMGYCLFLPSAAPKSGGSRACLADETCREWCNIKIWLGKPDVLLF